MNPSSSSHDNGANTPAQGRRRWLVYGLFGLLIVLVLLVVLAPTILSTPPGQRLVVSLINDTVRGSVTIDTLSLSWLGGQRIRGVEILDPAGTKVGRLEELSTELTLLEAIQRRLSLGQTTIRGLTADLVVDESGANNLGNVFEPRRSSTADAAPLAVPFTGNIELTDASMTVTSSDTEPVMFDALAGTMRIDPADRVLDVGLQGQSRQGDVTGKFSITGQISGLIGPDGALSPQSAKGDFNANVEDLPIDSVDAILGLQGLLSAAAGSSANLKIQASGTAQMQDLLITADSVNLRADIGAQVQHDRLMLTRPASVDLTVTPDLFQFLTRTDQGDAILQLAKPFPLRLQAETLDLSTAEFNLADVALRGDVEVDQPIQLTATGLGELTIESLNAAVDSERLADTVSVKLDGEVVSQNKPGELGVQIQLDQMFNEQGALQLDKMRADAAANLSNVPTLLIDQIAGQNGRLVDLLGAKMDLSAKAISRVPEQIDATLTVDAGPLKATDITLALTDSIALTKPAQIHYLLSPQVAQQLMGKDLGYSLRQPTQLVLEVQDLSVPLPRAGEPMIQPAATRVQGSLSSERLALSGVADIDTLQVDDVRFDLTADSLTSIHLRGSALVNEADRSILAELGASPLQVIVDSETSLDATGQLGPIDARLKLAGDGVNGEINMSIAQDLNRASLSTPGSMRLVLTPGLLQWLATTPQDQVTLAKPTPVEINVSRLDLPLDAFSLSDTQAEAAAHFDELILAGDESVAGAALRNADLAIDFDGTNGAATVRLAADTMPAGEQQAGTLQIDATLSRLLQDGELSLDAADVDAKAQIEALPTAMLAAFSGQTALVPIIGDTINIDASIGLAGDKSDGAIELKTESRNLTADMGFKLGDELALSRPSSVRLTLTPAGFDAVTNAYSAASQKDGPSSGYELTEDAAFEAVVTQLQWPLPAVDSKTQFDPSRAALVATASTPRLSLRDRVSGRTFSIEVFEIKLQGSDLSKPIDIELNGQIRDVQDEQSQPGAAPGRLTVSGQAADLFAQDGEFNSVGPSLRLAGQLQKLPTALLDQFLEIEGMMAATLGPAVDVTLDTHVQQMVGPLNLQLQSTGASADVKAQLQSDGLVLTEPLLAEVQVTQAFGKFVLGKIHPIFETAQSSERAIRFEVPPQGVFIPFREYDISKVVIPRMTLDLGQLTLKSGWLLRGAIGLAQQFGKLEESGRDQWTAQFTPAVLKLSEGKLTYDRRLDLLLDERMHLATWGTVDVANDRSNLILAFMPETLNKVFDLKVAPGDALRVPLRGSLSAPSVDFARAGLEVERLRQQQRLSERNKLLGTVAGAVATVAIDSTPMPPASVDPLPWGPLPVPEGEVEAQQAEESAQPTEPTTAPKSLEEQAIEGLMGIFRKKKE